MRIDVAELLKRIGADAKVETEFKLSFDKDELEITKPISLKAKLVNTGEEILMTGKVKTTVKLPCCRCLKPCEVKVESELEERFKTEAGERIAEKLELEDRDFVSALSKGRYIELDEVLRQVLLTALPTKPLCNENCKGDETES